MTGLFTSPSISSDYQLQQALQNKEAALVQLQDVERNLAASKERCLDQAADLLKKSGLCPNCSCFGRAYHFCFCFSILI